MKFIYLLQGNIAAQSVFVLIAGLIKNNKIKRSDNLKSLIYPQ